MTPPVPVAPPAGLKNPMTDPQWCDLGIGNLGLYQKKDGLRFSMDAVLLAHFPHPNPADHILDMGTGTGVIAFLLHLQYPEATILGLDLQPQLIENAKRSRDRNGISPQRVDFQVQDLRRRNKGRAGTFHQVICNPPFFTPGHGALSPDSERSLARHELTFTLPEIFQAAAYHLCHLGRFCLIHRSERLPEVLTTAAAHRLTPSRLQPIYARPGEPAKLFLLETIYGGRNGLTLETPRTIYDAQGNYTPSVLALYKGVD